MRVCIVARTRTAYDSNLYGTWMSKHKCKYLNLTKVLWLLINIIYLSQRNVFNKQLDINNNIMLIW